MEITKSIEHLNLRFTNPGKIEKLEALSVEYHSFLQQVIDYHIENKMIPKGYLENEQFSSPLSERYKQTAGLQAIRVVKTHFSKIQKWIKNKIKWAIEKGQIKREEAVYYYSANKWQLWWEKEDRTFTRKLKKGTLEETEEYTISQEVFEGVGEFYLEASREIKSPEIKKLTLELDSKVAVVGKSENSFDHWIKLSTLEKGKPIYLPLKLHKNAKKLLQEGEVKKLVRLKKRRGQWYASLVVEKTVDKGKIKGKQEKRKKEVGVDMGAKALLVDSEENFYGEKCYDQLKKKVDSMKENHKNRQKLERCLKKKQGEDFALGNKRYARKQEALTSWRKNEIGCSINEFVEKNKDRIAVIERLSLGGKKTRSRKVNGILGRSLMGYLKDKLEFRLKDREVAYIQVQAAYSSQECHRCGFVSRKNRRSQELFNCEICDYENHADLNASLNIRGRSQDRELNGLKVPCEVLKLLKKRFYDTHSVSSWLDLDSFLKMKGSEFREALNRQSATLKLKIV